MGTAVIIHFKRWWRVFALVFLTLTGCASADFPEDYRPHQSLSDVMSITPNSTVSVGWGISLPQGLKDYLQQSHVANLSLYVAKQKQIIAVADYYLISGNNIPAINTSFKASQNQTLNNDNKRSNESYDATFGVRWQADLWQRLALQRQAELADKVATDWDLASVNLSIEGQLLNAWLSIVEQRQLLNVFDRNYRNQKQRVAMLARRVDLGLTSTTGYDNAQLSLLKLKRDRLQAANRLRQAKGAFNLVLAQAPNEELAVPVDMPAIDKILNDEFEPSLLLSRPDVRASEARMLAAGYRWDEAQKNQLPSLTLDASYRVRQDKISNVFDLDYWLSSVGVSLVQPLFFRDELGKKQQIARARAEIAKANYFTTVLKAWKNIQDLSQSSTTLAQQVTAATLGLESAVRVEKNTLERYENGLASSFDVLAAQRNTVTASSELIRLQVAQLKNRVNLRLAFGPLKESV